MFKTYNAMMEGKVDKDTLVTEIANVQEEMYYGK